MSALTLTPTISINLEPLNKLMAGASRLSKSLSRIISQLFKSKRQAGDSVDCDKQGLRMKTVQWKMNQGFKNSDEFRYELLTYFEDMPRVLGYKVSDSSQNDYPTVVFDFDKSSSLAMMHFHGDDCEQLVVDVVARLNTVYRGASIEVVDRDDVQSVNPSDNCNSFTVAEFSLNGKDVKEAFKRRNMALFRDKEKMRQMVINRIFSGVCRWQGEESPRIIADSYADRSTFVCIDSVEFDDVEVSHTTRGYRAVVKNLRFKAKMEVQAGYPLFIGAEVNKGFGKVVPVK